MKSRWQVYLFVLTVLGMALFSSSCATTGEDDEESDLPWNSQQPWERTLNIPGMSDY
ncbi:MAG: hypothetical protein KJ626_14485 [Verrucomicrobia bacterium]|nr:hypothetical protein [Verrucomicrobiota bacterium]